MKHCLNCFGPITDSWFSRLISDYPLCQRCFQSLTVIEEEMVIATVRGLALYQYDENLKGMIYRLKGAGDYVLKDVFFSPFRAELRWRLRGYTLVPIPSNQEDDQQRGFNHVEALISSLNLPMAKVLKKKSPWKQSDKSFQQRKQISKVLQLSTDQIPPKICFVDDVCTTGETLKAAIALVSTKCAKITFLVVGKRRKTSNDFP